MSEEREVHHKPGLLESKRDRQKKWGQRGELPAELRQGQIFWAAASTRIVPIEPSAGAWVAQGGKCYTDKYGTTTDTTFSPSTVHFLSFTCPTYAEPADE
jgi:hypothetical protein